MFWAILAVSAAVLILNIILLVRQKPDDGRALRDDFARFQAQNNQSNEALRASVLQQIALARGETTDRLETIRNTVDQRLASLQADNSARLDQMRQTVDEKLQATLETRLGESFRLVSERLEQVHRGLGEMRTLAAGVGDLKKVLSNVTTRGAWGEVQLDNLITQMLAPDQFERNVSVTGTGERVEFAIKLPGQDTGTVWLPIDAKFPAEAYQRLVCASEGTNPILVEACAKELETVIRTCAKTFSSKYLAPPRTTDFGILFLATEGLYAEALRRPGLAESLQNNYHVILAGPTTFAALLNSLQMGFRTLAIQQRSGEVWTLLADVKTQFGKYSEVLSAIRRKLDSAVETVDQAEVRTRAIQKKLRDVEDAPAENLFELRSAG